MGENFPKVDENFIQKSQQTPSKINTKRSTLIYILIKLLTAQNKENLESNKSKTTHHIQESHMKING